mgnify:CR=1 FL=1
MPCVSSRTYTPATKPALSPPSPKPARVHVLRVLARSMESTCPPGCIHVSYATAELLQDEEWEPTGGVMVKGKGEMQTYRWVPPVMQTSLVTGALMPAVGRAGRNRARVRRASSMASLGSGVAAAAASGGLMGPLGGGAQGSTHCSGHSSRALAPMYDHGGGGGAGGGGAEGSGCTPSCSALANAVVGCTAGANGGDSGAENMTAGGSFARGSSGTYVHSFGAAGGGKRSSAAASRDATSGLIRPSAQQVNLATTSGTSSGPGRGPAGHVHAPPCGSSHQSRSRRLMLQHAAEVAATSADAARSAGSMPAAKPKRKPHRSCSTTAIAYAGRPPLVV